MTNTSHAPNGGRNPVKRGLWRQRSHRARNESRAAYIERLLVNKGKRKISFSIQTKILALIFGALALFGVISALVSYRFYEDATIAQHKQLGVATSALVASVIDADRVSSFIKEGTDDEGYLMTRRKLEIIKGSSPNIEYVYVYKILPQGCQVVFDLDTSEDAQSQPGSIVKFDDSFKEYLPALMKGEKIEPVISDDTYGWLLTVYTPVRDSKGVTQCYAAVDISMNDLRNDSKRFFNTLAQFFSLVMLFILIPAAIWARKMINPINRMAETTGRFVFDNEKSMEENLSKIARLNIRTGDELENLYRSFVKMTGDSVRYIKDINQKNATIQKMHENLLVTIAELVENRDENTGQHIRKTAKYVSLILEEMRRRGVYADKLTDEYINSVVQAAPLHDVGKIHVPDMILNKPGKLTDEEFEVMKTHTTHGGKIIDTIIELMPESNYLAEAKNLAMYHHEKWNGKGYPSGLAGEDIPLSARVMAVADVFDALVSRRSYKEGFPYEKALGIIQQESGKHFDPQVVEAFMAVKDKALETADGFIARANAPFNTTPATSKA